jgi:hypothetical protein
MFKRIALVGMLLIVAAGPTPASGDNRMREIMRTKLSNAQVLLQAIVTVNYKDIDRSAAALNRISEMEIVSWQNPPRREYTEQAMLFIASVDDLRAASQKHDIEGVGAALFQRSSPPASTVMHMCATPASRRYCLWEHTTNDADAALDPAPACVRHDRRVRHRVGVSDRAHAAHRRARLARRAQYRREPAAAWHRQARAVWHLREAVPDDVVGLLVEPRHGIVLFCLDADHKGHQWIFYAKLGRSCSRCSC